ncbi:unnamed protein product, partial [Meganyctiphanes norvegica]
TGNSSNSNDTGLVATADGLSIPKDLLTDENVLLIRVTKGGLSAEDIAKFLEKGTDEHNNFKNGLDELKAYMKKDAQTEYIKPDQAELANVVRIDADSVRADYAVPCNPSLVAKKFENDLEEFFNPKTAFNMDGTVIKVKKVPVPKKANVFQAVVIMTGEEFKPEYKDQKSKLYKDFKENYENKMLIDLQAKIPDAKVFSVVLLELRKGSLIANSLVNTETDSSPSKIQSGLTDVAEDPNSQLNITSPVVDSPTYVASGAEAEEVKPIVEPETDYEEDKTLTKGKVPGFISPEDVELKYSDTAKNFMKYFVSVTIPAFCVIFVLLLCLFCCTGQSCQALCGEGNAKAKSIP